MSNVLLAPLARLCAADFEDRETSSGALTLPEVISAKRRHTLYSNSAETVPRSSDAAQRIYVLKSAAGNASGDADESYHSLNARAVMLMGRGELAAAEPLLLLALAGMRRSLGDLHVHTLHAMCTAALLLQSRGNLTAAEALLTEAVAGKRRRLREGHPDILQAVSNLAALVYARGDVASAEPMFREVFIYL